jgi:hypothetical protein
MDRKIIEWIQKNKVKGAVIFIIMTCIVAAVAAFVVHCGTSHAYSQISADGMLSYIGSVLAAVGTIAVSIVAAWQAKKSNELSVKALELERLHYKMEIRPFALVSDVQFDELTLEEIIGITDELKYNINYKNEDTDQESSSNKYGTLIITFSNTTNSIITIELIDIVDGQTGDTWYHSKVNNVLKRVLIENGKDKHIIFNAPYAFWEDIRSKKVTFELILENRFGERYQENVDICLDYKCKINSDFSKVQATRNRIFYSAQDYKIGRFVDTENVKWESNY